MSTKQEIISDAVFKAWPFSSNFNFACKDGGVIAATCKYYCPLVVNPTITNCCKELNVAKFLYPSLKTLSWTKTSPVSSENRSFSYYFEMLPTLSKVIAFFSVTFYSMMKYF